MDRSMVAQSAGIDTIGESSKLDFTRLRYEELMHCIVYRE